MKKLIALLVVAGFATISTAAFAASAGTKVTSGVGPEIGRALEVPVIRIVKDLNFDVATDVVASTQTILGVLGVTTANTWTLANVPAGFKITEAYWYGKTVEGTTSTLVLQVGDVTAVTGLDMNTLTPSAGTVVNLVPPIAASTLKIISATATLDDAAGRLVIYGYATPILGTNR